MAEEEYPGPVHDQVTRRSRFRYFFYDKHHTLHNTADAQWLPSLTPAEEFTIFDQADFDQIMVPNGDLFGMRRTPDGEFLPLGTEQQHIAEFPATEPPRAWHGYPLWPLKKAGDIRRGRLPAPKEALRLMVKKKWITESQRRRLAGAKHIS